MLMSRVIKLFNLSRTVVHQNLNNNLIKYIAKSYEAKSPPIYYFENTEASANSYKNRPSGKSKLGFLPCFAIGIALTFDKFFDEFKIFKFSNFLKHGVLPSVKASSIIVNKPRVMMNFIADVVEKTAAAVVCIEIKDTRRRDFFTGQFSTRSSGSGFIVKEDGLILTNAHVILSQPGSVILVKLYDGSVHKAYVEAVDKKTDLATIRINANKSLPVLKLGSSSDIRPGEWVVAIGSPLTLENTITAGVVSSAHRSSNELGLRDKNIDYIQTDAAITFGNSGGPLVNLDGEAIGINAMKITPGISFAIPIDAVKNFLTRAQENKSTQKPKYLGITMLTLSDDITRELGMYRDHKGVIVWRVVIGSPADVGGLVPGDIIISINGKQIKNADDVHSILDSTNILKIELLRKNMKKEVTVQAEEN
uniref:Serine protease HTRA2, mitochondrial n=1 Tax=Clastoptera arizonana TaxID=38151 RepID=A0A1B6D6U0_9HEMI